MHSCLTIPLLIAFSVVMLFVVWILGCGFLMVFPFDKTEWLFGKADVATATGFVGSTKPQKYGRFLVLLAPIVFAVVAIPLLVVVALSPFVVFSFDKLEWLCDKIGRLWGPDVPTVEPKYKPGVRVVSLSPREYSVFRRIVSIPVTAIMSLWHG